MIMEITDNNDIPGMDLLRQDISAPSGMFDRIEAALFDRIEKFERGQSPEKTMPPWEAVVALDETVPPELVDNSEQELFDRISQADNAEPWELYVKKDIIGTEDLSALEKRLSYTIPATSTPYSFPLLFSTMSLAISKYKTTFIALLILVFGVSAFYGWYAFRSNDLPLATILTAQGGMPRLAGIVRESQTVRSAAGQTLVLSNRRGTVVVADGAEITIRKARRRRMEYAVDFKEYTPETAGRVIFAVTKKIPGQEFSVTTKDYTIHVVGTVFRLTPQARGRTAVQVLEGAVWIEGEGVATLVTAGDLFAFSDKAGAYAVAQAEMDRLPNSQNHPLPETAFAPRKPEPQFHHVNKGFSPPRDSLLELAVRLEALDWKKSVETYRAVLARSGSSAYGREIALFSIGRLLYDNGAAAPEIREAFNEYLKKFPGGNFTGESYLRLADLEYKTDPGRALVWYEKYLKEFPLTQNTAAAEYKAGLILLQQNKRGRAAALLSNALSDAKNYPADQIAAIRRTLDNAKSPRNDSAKNGSLP